MAKKNVTRNKIAKHYKKFFAIEDMALAENDQLMIDWGMALIEDSLPIPDVIKSVCDDCTAYPFDERGKTPLCKTCKDNPSQTVL